MCEINSHGGIVVERKILEECLKMAQNLQNQESLLKSIFKWKNRFISSRICNRAYKCKKAIGKLMNH